MYRSRKHNATKVVHVVYGSYLGGGRWTRICDGKRLHYSDRSWVPGTPITCFQCLAWLRLNYRTRVDGY